MDAIASQIEDKKNIIENKERILSEGRQDFMEFALEYIDHMGAHFFELPLEEVAVCKRANNKIVCISTPYLPDNKLKKILILSLYE